MISRSEIRDAVRRLTSALAFGGSIAAMVVLLGTRDVESYEHAFFSLDRGTAAQAVHVLGHPVYTLALGLGVRLPLHGSLGASPAAALAPYLPVPLTYWLLLAFSISSAVLLALHALKPLCGRPASWLAIVFLFCSVPMVNYTIYDDWPETAVTYCAFVGCVFAPHALLPLLDSQRSSKMRRLASFSLAAMVWGLVGLSHPGYWPLLAGALVLSAILALSRSEYPLRHRFTVVVALAAASCTAVALQVPDITRELYVAAANAGEMKRLVQGPQGSLISANVFPFGELSPRLPFTFLVLALVSLVIGLTSNEEHARRLTVGSALMSIALGIGAAMLLPGRSVYAPSSTWALRDPAIAFAVLSGACAAGAVHRSRGGDRLVGTGPVLAALAVAALVLAGLQGPWYAARFVLWELPEWRDHRPWTRNMTAPGERPSMRGLARDRVSPDERLAIWPGVRDEMRLMGLASTDFADAGYTLVTARTKQRTMRGLVEPNELLFNQTTDLAPQVLCAAGAMKFLQLRYLLAPPDIECPPWKRLPGLLVDGWLEVRAIREWDDRVRALPVASLSEQLGREPALSVDSLLLSRLVPLFGTSLRVGPRDVVIRLDDSSVAAGQALVLPVAYDPAWRASAGQVHNVGGLVALIGVDQHQVTLDFVPDVVAVLRALSMSVAQVLAAIGFLGLAYVRPLVADDAPIVASGRFALKIGAAGARGVFAVITRVLRTPRNWLYLGYIVAVMQRLDWLPEDSDETSLLTALLLPITALVTARLTQLELWHRWVGGTMLALALLRVATGGSLAAQAPHDPLFWGLMATVALSVSMASRRWPIAATLASALAGACTVVAILLPMFPDFESTFPDLDFTAISQSFSALSDQLGALATVLLLSLWLHAIVIGGTREGGSGRIGAAGRGALLAALMLALAGAVPTTGIEVTGIVALGVLLGLAEAKARQSTHRTYRKQGTPSAPNVPVG